MKKPHSRGKFDVEVECKFLDLPPAELRKPAACLYEYLRESQKLRDAIANIGCKESSGKARVLPNFAFADSFRLVQALIECGFPKPWNRLKDGPRKKLGDALNKRADEMLDLHPPIRIDELRTEPTMPSDAEPTGDFLKAVEPVLLGEVEPLRDYFFGTIRIDEAFDKITVVEAFKAWFADRYAKRGKGNPQFIGKLNQLAAMRVRHFYPRGERERILAQVTGKATFKPVAGQLDSSTTDKADTGLSRDCKEAREFFQRLFPGEDPIHFPTFRKS